MQQDLFHLLDVDARILETLLDRAGDGLQRIFVEFASLHLEEERFQKCFVFVRVAHAQHHRMLERVGADVVREDSVLGFACFEDGRACAIGVDQTVAIVGIGNARQRISANDHCALDVAGANHRVGPDDALQPARTSEDDIDSDGVRVFNLELVLHSRGNRWHEIGAQTSCPHIAEVVRDDDVVEFFAVDA